MAKPSVETLNRHMIAAHQGRIVIQLVPRDLSPPQACELAAWLVCMADMAPLLQARDGRLPQVDPSFNAEEHFAEALKQIRNA